MKKVIINAFGPDERGIVYKITRVITSLNGNVENSKMIRLESDFTILMLLKIPEKNIKTLDMKLSKIKNLNINIKITEILSVNKDFQQYNFRINVADNEGIIYIFSELFNQYKINIEKMESEIKNAPISGSPIFILTSLLNLPKKLNINNFKKDLDKIASKNNIDYSFNKNVKL